MAKFVFNPFTGTFDITLSTPVAIAEGGTGQITKAAAFDALSPNTTKGDLIGYSTTNIRVPIGTDGQVLTADAASTAGFKWAVVTPTLDSSQDDLNLILVTSVSANALTIAVKTKAGVDPSAGDPVKVAFRNATASDGSYSVNTTTAALSIVVVSGATLGHISAVQEPIFVYALDNGGTTELAVSSRLFDYTTSQTTTAMTSASDSRIDIYSTTARTSKSIRLIGKINITEATAGTWSSNADRVKVLPLPDSLSEALQVVNMSLNTSVNNYIIGALSSGTYQPTITNVTNAPVNSIYIWQWMRVGSVVTVSGRFDATPTAGSVVSPVSTVLNLSLPVTNGNFSASTTGAAGTLSSADGKMAGSISPNSGATTIGLQFSAISTSANSFWVTFTYMIQ